MVGWWTDLCVQINKRIDPKEFIATSEISELCGIREDRGHLIFGGNVSWKELEEWALVNWPNVKEMLDLSHPLKFATGAPLLGIWPCIPGS